MAQTIKLKRSATTGNAPTASQLALGELGINTTDGKLFLKKSVSGTESIVEVGGLPLSGGTLTGNLSLGDNVKLQLGNQTNGDLQIYHDGSHSYIADVGTGDLVLQAGNDLILRQPDGSTEYLRANEGAGVQIYHNGSQKFLTTSTGIDVTGTISFGDSHTIGNDGFDNLTITSSTSENIVLKPSGATYIEHAGSTKFVTTSTGIDVTGTATMDSLTVDGDAVVQSLQPRFILKETDVTDQNTRLRNTAGDLQIQTINDAFTVASNRLTLDHATGDISFYEDTGTTAKLFWDASAESLGIGTSSPDQSLVVNGQIGLSYDATNSYQGLKRSGVGTVYYTGTTSTATDAIHTFTGSSDAVKMTILEGGRVGIGTSSPSSALEVVGGASLGSGFTQSRSGHPTFGITNGGTDSVYFSLAPNGGSHQTFMQVRDDDTDVSSVAFSTSGSERMRIDSTGIAVTGTASATSVTSAQHLTAGSAYSLLFGDGGERISGNNSSSLLNFFTGATERMRILSTGSVLFGQSVNDRPAEFAQPTGASIAGASGYLHGQYQSSVSGMNMLLNRKGTDGTILGLRKDGTDVGSIGAQSGRLTVGSNSAAGVRFDGTQLVPMSGASISDNTITLGDPGFRFKDLYLSGGVYLGGTGAANLLDDYEYGTFTPTSGVALTVISANYTKIGRQVTIVVDLEFASSTSGSYAAVSLPFTSTVNNYTGGSMNYTTYSASIASVNVESSVYFRSTSLLGGNLSYASVAGKRFIFSATYFTAS